MKRSEVTYGQLDKALPSLGFSCRLLPGDPPARVYEHHETGASFMLPPFPDSDRVLDYHLVGAQTTLDNFGIADAERFEAQPRKAG
ncbi:MAG TPA: hypothetical protein VFA18_24335 [Gemmataceae bacterium]|nr:hypothetical protein [Gemmataceae bacterium]